LTTYRVTEFKPTPPMALELALFVNEFFSLIQIYDGHSPAPQRSFAHLFHQLADSETGE